MNETEERAVFPQHLREINIVNWLADLLFENTQESHDKIYKFGLRAIHTLWDVRNELKRMSDLGKKCDSLIEAINDILK
jgi:hypothetical protein